jgi:hypothetical protein
VLFRPNQRKYGLYFANDILVAMAGILAVIGAGRAPYTFLQTWFLKESETSPNVRRAIYKKFRPPKIFFQKMSVSIAVPEQEEELESIFDLELLWNWQRFFSWENEMVWLVERCQLSFFPNSSKTSFLNFWSLLCNFRFWFCWSLRSWPLISRSLIFDRFFRSL